VKDTVRAYNTYDPTLQPKLFLIGNILSGGIAGAATTVVGFPMDFARTRVAMDIAYHAKDREFHGTIDCLKKVWKSDGIRGVYRGVGISLPAFFLYRGYYFGLYDTGKQWFLTSDSSYLTKWLLA
jgi:solute carrier family 25 (adenine nucleotide translocator) protein 4/5/6/31